MPEAFPQHPTPREMDRPWIIYRSNFTDYMEDFSHLNENGMVDRVLDAIRALEYPPLVVDLMATPEAVASFKTDILNGKPMFGITVGKQSDQEIIDKPIPTNSSEFHYINGDLNQSRTWNAIQELSDNLAQGRKVNLYMSRAFGGLNYIPTDIRYERAALSRIWNALDNDCGAMMLQIPAHKFLAERNVPIDAWLEKLKEQAIEYTYVPEYISDGNDAEYGLLMVLKSGDSPLPQI